jgi:hypothetical protein
LKAVRDEAFTEYGDIDPREEQSRARFAIELSEAFGMRSVYGSIRSLVDNPRKFKHMLRHTLDTWQRLHGEVDLDDLTIVNVLRYCAPKALEFLLSHMDLLRGGVDPLAMRRDRKDEETIRHMVQEAWAGYTKGSPWDVESAAPHHNSRPASQKVF